MLQGENNVLSSWFEVGQGMNRNSHVICMEHACGVGFFSIIRSLLSTILLLLSDCTGLSEACIQPLGSGCSVLQQAVFLVQNIPFCLLHR